MKVLLFIVLVYFGFAAAKQTDPDVFLMTIDDDITPQNADEVQLFVAYITALLKADGHSEPCIANFQALFKNRRNLEDPVVFDRNLLDAALADGQDNIGSKQDAAAKDLILVDLITKLLTTNGHSEPCVARVRDFLYKLIATARDNISTAEKILSQ